jgi:hypothetical protein
MVCRAIHNGDLWLRRHVQQTTPRNPINEAFVQWKGSLPLKILPHYGYYFCKSAIDQLGH